MEKHSKDSSEESSEFLGRVGSIRLKRRSEIGFVGSSRTWWVRSWTRRLAARATAARCQQRWRADQSDIGMDTVTAGCSARLAQ